MIPIDGAATSQSRAISPRSLIPISITAFSVLAVSPKWFLPIRGKDLETFERSLHQPEILLLKGDRLLPRGRGDWFPGGIEN
jgi:hypothetical protein